MQIDIFTLFPEWFDWFLGQRHVRNALRLGHDVRLFNYRDTTPLSAGQVDDSPYGGGAGMVIRVDVVDAALQAVYGPDTDALLASRRVAVLAASGRRLDDAVAEELAGLDALTLLCGRYEGIDERVTSHLANDSLSIGPYVLSGGELAAMVVTDVVVRKLPGHARARGERAGGVLLAGPRRGAGVPALHPARLLPRVGGARRAALRAPRGGPPVAA